VSLAIGCRNFDADDMWVRSMKRALGDELQEVVVADLSNPAGDGRQSDVDRIREVFSDDRIPGVLILKYGDEFVGKYNEAAADLIDDSLIQAIRSLFVLHPNADRRVVITGTGGGYSGETAGHMLTPLLRRLHAGADASIDGMALNMRLLNHRQVAEMIWGIGYDRRAGYNETAVEYVIRVLQRHLPLLPAFLSSAREDARRPVNSVGYENPIAIQGSSFSHPRPASQNLLTVTTRSSEIPGWYRSRLNEKRAIYGKSAQAPRVPHTIFNVNVTAAPLATMTRPMPLR
jgi:hypothetical protein